MLTSNIVTTDQAFIIHSFLGFGAFCRCRVSNRVGQRQDEFLLLSKYVGSEQRSHSSMRRENPRVKRCDDSLASWNQAKG